MKLTRIVILVVLGLSVAVAECKLYSVHCLQYVKEETKQLSCWHLPTHFYAYIINIALSDSVDLESSSEDRELESSFDTGSSEDDDDDDIELLGDYIRQELSELEDEVWIWYFFVSDTTSLYTLTNIFSSLSPSSHSGFYSSNLSQRPSWRP